MDSSFQNGLTAAAGGAQLGATVISRTYSRFVTVASVGDSALLSPAAGGLSYVIKNAATNSMNIFPCSAAQGGARGDPPNIPSGDQINALGVNTAFAIPGGKAAIFFSAVNGTWDAILSA
jgi:hypothetical protein